jgi:hypothetical protein
VQLANTRRHRTLAEAGEKRSRSSYVWQHSQKVALQSNGSTTSISRTNLVKALSEKLKRLFGDMARL